MGRGTLQSWLATLLVMVSQAKHWWFCNLNFARPIISEMLNQNLGDNGVNRTGPFREGSLLGKCSLFLTAGTQLSSCYYQNKVD